MSELYRAIAGSPITYLSSDISAAQTTISIADDSALPDAPNICTIGYGENIETIRYGAKSNGVLQNVTRGIEGTPRAWPAGTEVARFFTAYDHNSIIENFNSHLADIANYIRYETMGDQSIASTSWTTIDFDKAIYTNSDLFTVDGGVFTCKKDGTYQFIFGVKIANTTSRIDLRARKGLTDIYRLRSGAFDPALGRRIQMVGFMKLSANQTIDFQVAHYSGVAINVESDSATTYIDIRKVG